MPLLVTTLALTGAVALTRPAPPPHRATSDGWHAPTPSSAPRAVTPDSLDALRRGERYARWMIDGPADSLLAAMTPEAAARIGGVAGLDERRAAIRRDLGEPGPVVRQSVELAPDGRTYVRIARFTAVSGALVRIALRLDHEGRIVSGELATIPEDDEPERPAVR